MNNHYRQGDIEAIEYMYLTSTHEAFEGHLDCTVKKYLHRWRYKEDPIKDLRKARDYLSALIDFREDSSRCPQFKEFTND